MKGLAIVAVCMSALAAAAPLPAAQHKTPLVFDEASVMISVGASPVDSDAGYMFRAHVEMTGFGTDQDTVRMEWKAGGKVVATAACKMARSGPAYAAGGCEFKDKPIKNVGAVEADLIFHDDADDKEYLVRTFKLNVVHYKGQWSTWALLQDDLLGAAWIWMDANQQYVSGTYRRPNLYAWFTNTDFLGKAVLRCTVNGTKKLEDIQLSEQGSDETGEVELDHQPKAGARVTYRWKHAKLNMDVYWGKRDTLEHDLPKTTPPDHVMSDNPGKWDCALRYEGKNIRQLAFTVDKDGVIAQDEMQSGKGAIPTVSNRVVLVDWRFTKEAFDKRIDPAAMKKSMPYGLPWPDHPKVKTIQATFPAKVGADPK